MAERLHFNTGMTYESMLAAEHLTRYWLLRDACKGKRVLDVACGEGYGSSLLRAWGAAEVVGIDLSQEAIENAQTRFGAPGISYRIGDACNLHTVLEDTEQFDLVACFETMEHVPDVPGLLRGIRARLAPGGSIAISCPNDPEVSGDHSNEFHLRTYTFEEFQAVTTEILGAAVQWQLGTPVLGFGICNSTDQWIQGLGPHLTHMLDGADSAAARFLPAQSGHEVGSQTASFYVGVWGTPLPRTMVVAPIAHRAYVAPWNNWVAAREENDRLAASVAAAVATASGVAKRLDDSLVEYDQMQRKVLTLEGELGAYKRQIATERSARLQMAAKLHKKDQQMAAKLHEMDWQHQQIQLAYRTVEAERDTLNVRLDVLCSSRSYRAIQRYYRLYEHGATRWFMRPLRRLVVWLRRLIKD